MATRNNFGGTIIVPDIELGPLATPTTLLQVSSNPNGVVPARGGSLAQDPVNGVIYVNTAVANATGTTWVNLGVSASVAIFGQVCDTTTITLVANSTYTQDFTVTEDSNGVSVTNDGLGNPTRLTVGSDGVYAFTISPQILKGGGGQTSIAFWAALQDNPITRSASIIDLPNNVQTLPFIELIVRMNAGQYVQWLFRTPGNGVAITNVAAAAPVPQAPSVIAGVKRIGA